MKRQNEKLIIAFFGPGFGNSSRRNALNTWWKWTDEVCNCLGKTLTHVGGVFGNKPGSMRNDKAYSLRRSRRRFVEQLETDNVVLLELDALDDSKQYSSFDWSLTSECGCGRRGARALMGLDCDAILSWNPPELSKFMRQCLELAKSIEVNYGFAVIMPRDFLPAGYAIGITTGFAGAKLLHDTAAWRNHAERECGHLLRNLYGWNILTPAHLVIDIGGMPLKDWINASSNRGRLYEIAPPLWCWTFEDLTEGNEYLRWECEAVEAIRRELEGYQLFPWQSIH